MILIQYDKYYIEQTLRMVCGGQKDLYDLLLSVHIILGLLILCMCIYVCTKVNLYVPLLHES